LPCDALPSKAPARSAAIKLTAGETAAANLFFSRDTVARILAEPLTKRLGQQVIVEAKPGATGTAAAGQVARAAPDGYTLIALPATHVATAATFRTLPFAGLGTRYAADRVPAPLGSIREHALAAPSAGTGGPGASVAGENIIAFDLDRLLRGDRRQVEDISSTRAEAARILVTASSHSGVAAEDRAYLVRLVSTRTGLAPPEAERRTDTAIASAKENIARARRSTVILAFMAGAAALLGAAAAWFAAVAGGEQRDERTPAGSWQLFSARRTNRRVFP